MALAVWLSAGTIAVVVVVGADDWCVCVCVCDMHNGMQQSVTMTFTLDLFNNIPSLHHQK